MYRIQNFVKKVRQINPKYTTECHKIGPQTKPSKEKTAQQQKTFDHFHCFSVFFNFDSNSTESKCSPDAMWTGAICVAFILFLGETCDFDAKQSFCFQ